MICLKNKGRLTDNRKKRLKLHMHSVAEKVASSGLWGLLITCDGEAEVWNK
jgi:hypothetical protein